MLEGSLPTPENSLKGGSPILTATGPPGRMQHAAYCTPQCYAKGKVSLSGSCVCRGCRGDAHGRGKKYAFEHGYLKYSVTGSRKPPLDQELLFSEEALTPIEDAERP